MFNKKLLVYFSKTHLFIYTKDITIPIRLEFEPDTIQDMERINKDWIRLNLKGLLSKSKLKNSKAVLLLSKDIVFDKLINEELEEAKIKETTEFVEHIPLDTTLIRYKEFIKDDNVLVAATNKELYLTVVEILAEYGIEVTSVLPEIVFNKVDFNRSFIVELFKQKDLLEYGNFLDKNPKKQAITARTLIILGVVILLLGIGIGTGAYLIHKKGFQFEAVRNTLKEVTPKEELKIEEKAEVTEEKKSKQVKNKDEVSVAIFNGMGIPGFAGKVATLINNAGFKSTTTANADKFNYTNTLIELSPDVDESLVDEIRDALKEDLKSFEIKKSLDTPKSIRVTTGEVVQK